MMLEVGAFTTITPDWVAARTSTLSSPTPARATTDSCLATASASASTLVADRIRMASTSAIADNSSARSAPLQCRISKWGPSASTVAGLSSSAISTTGLVTATVSSTQLVRDGEEPSGSRTTLCPVDSTRAVPRSLTRLRHVGRRSRAAEQGLADVLTRLRPGRDGEDRGAGEPEVLHHRVVARHPGLQRDEVRTGVADERDEEEAGVEPSERVGAVDEVVPAPQHPYAVVALGADHGHVRVGRDQRAVRPLHGQVERGHLGAAGERGSAALRAPDDVLLRLQALPVPGLDVHVDPAGDEIRA